MNICKRIQGKAVAFVVSLAAVCAIFPAGAMASEFALFEQCPLSSPGLSGCILAKTESGKVTLGNKTVPITNTITLQGGFTENRITGEQKFVGAENGETLSKTPQPVPGGLLGVVAPEALPKFLQEIINKLVSEGLAGVTATTELAAPASSIGLSEENLISAKGTALSLPVKIKLDNVFLGGACYIGSNSSPLVLNLTTGTTSPPKPNEPITGSVGTLTGSEEGAILTITGNSLVNNSFAAPGASGCGGILSFLIDPAVNLEIGLPAAAGHNTAILNGTLKQAGAESVEEHR